MRDERSSPAGLCTPMAMFTRASGHQILLMGRGPGCVQKLGHPSIQYYPPNKPTATPVCL